ncbi:MAG: TolC family protein [Bacteroidaceae bacterium]|nr:TolC family protein [Bacteroidaceae bacterium]
MKLRLSFLLIITVVSTSLLCAPVAAPFPEGSNREARQLSFQQLSDSALHNNIAIRQARYKKEASKEQRKEAFTNFFPSISATGMTFRANREMAKMDIDPSEFISPDLGATLAQTLPMEALAALNTPMSMLMMKEGSLAGVTALQPLFAGGQILYGNKLARIGEGVSDLQMKLTENDVVAQVEQYYWQLVSMREKARTLDAVDTMLTQIGRDVEVAVNAGVVLRNDLLQVQLRQNEIQSQRLKLTNGQMLVKMLLAQFCGLKQEWELEATASASSFTDLVGLTPLSDCNSTALSSLPEYQLLEKNVEASKLQRKMEVAKNLPSVAVGAGYNYHNLLENDRHFGMVFATVSVPISDWWGGSHAIRRKKLAEQEAKELLEDNAEKLKIRMQKAWNDMVEAQSQIALADRGLEQAAENLRVHSDTYKAGTTSMSNLLEAQLFYQQACDKKTDACIALQNARTAYRHATGQ